MKYNNDLWKEVCKFPDKHYMNQLVFAEIDAANAMNLKPGEDETIPLRDLAMFCFELGMKYKRALDSEPYYQKVLEEDRIKRFENK